MNILWGCVRYLNLTGVLIADSISGNEVIQVIYQPAAKEYFLVMFLSRVY